MCIESGDFPESGTISLIPGCQELSVTCVPSSTTPSLGSGSHH